MLPNMFFQSEHSSLFHLLGSSFHFLLGSKDQACWNEGKLIFFISCWCIFKLQLSHLLPKQCNENYYSKLLTKYSTGIWRCSANHIKRVPSNLQRQKMHIENIYGLLCETLIWHHTKMSGTIRSITTRCEASEGFLYIMVTGFFLFLSWSATC